MADEVLVINVGGYLGEITRSEIEIAMGLGKPIRYLEPVERWSIARVGRKLPQPGWARLPGRNGYGMVRNFGDLRKVAVRSTQRNR
jgi:hypothetical protein